MTRVRIAAIPLALVVASGLVACSSSDIEIVWVLGERNSTKIRLGLDGCFEKPVANVEETDSDVRVSLTAVADSGDDCRQDMSVRLNDPLGGRSVIDESTGEQIVVTSVR